MTSRGHTALRRSPWVAAMLCALVLVGCATNALLQRPSPGALVLGTTSLQDILLRYGTPSSKKTLQIRGHRIQSCSYTFTDPGVPAYKIPEAETARGLYLYFDQEVLVGFNYLSSFPDDHTDFENDLVADLVEGRSREAEVIARLGAPSGESMYPLTRRPGTRHLVYSFVQVVAHPFGPGQSTSKTLVIAVDSSGVVRELSYQEDSS